MSTAAHSPSPAVEVTGLTKSFGSLTAVDRLSADDLLLGWKIAKANNEMQAASEYEAQLRMNYPYSPELEAVGGKGDDE